jgi:hypothetical protein
MVPPYSIIVPNILQKESKLNTPFETFKSPGRIARGELEKKGGCSRGKKG